MILLINSSRAPGDIGLYVIKGDGDLRVITATGQPMTKRIAAIRCSCAEEAIAMSRVFGDENKSKMS
jgi:hypothetical protein